MSQVFERCGENGICKDCGTGWLLLGAVDSIKRENDPIRSINYQFKANCQKAFYKHFRLSSFVVEG